MPETAGQFGIGEVLAQLRPEFPDISTSKIRFLEAEGLIEPARSRSGYRRFSTTDIERLRYILTMQRDSYLPLRVIRERLADGVAGAEPGPRGGPPRPPRPDRGRRRSPRPGRGAPPRRGGGRGGGRAGGGGGPAPGGGAPPGRAAADMTRRQLLDAAEISEAELTE